MSVSKSESLCLCLCLCCIFVIFGLSRCVLASCNTYASIAIASTHADTDSHQVTSATSMSRASCAFNAVNFDLLSTSSRDTTVTSS